MAVASPQRPSPARAAFAVFGVLVLATVAAFFVTQRLKRSTPVVRHVTLPLYISPNGDGRKDTVRIGFTLPKTDRVTVAIVNSGGDEIRRLADDRRLHRGRHRFRWTGRDNSGAVPPDGTYYLRVTLRDEGRAATAPRGIQLVTARPRPRLVSVSPSRLAAGGRSVSIRYSGPVNPPATFSVYRTDLPGRPRAVATFPGRRGSTTARWAGRDARGRPVPPGSYAFAVTVQNRALVAGSSPAKLPPAAATATPRTGVTVAGAQPAGPLEPVGAGSGVRVALDGARGRVRYRLVPAGGGRALDRGVARARVLRVHVPRRARTGLYVARVRTPAGRVAVPIAVQARSSRAARVLVVLPAITWQGLNPVDSDSDGFPDTLRDSRSVALARPFAFGRLPAGIGGQIAPLLAFLRQQRVRYDLTTDLALARGRGPGFGGHSGVLFAGSELWLPTPLLDRVRAYAVGGGHIASFGTDAFRRSVRVTPTALAAPGAVERANAFGETTAPARSAAAPLVVGDDALGVFSGSDGYIGLFTRFEQQQALAKGATVRSAAGRDPRHPAFVAYSLGKGTVVRIGTPQWSGALRDDPEVQAVTRSVWELLSR